MNTKRVSKPMLRAMQNVARGYPVGVHFKNQAEHGGFHHTLRALVKRGFMTWDHKLTDAAREILKKMGAT